MTPRNPFAHPDALTLAHVLARLEADTSFPLQRRRDLCSAVRTVGRWFNLGLTEIPANYEFLRRGFKNFHPRFANVRQRRLENVRSFLTAALQHVGIPTNRQTYLAPLAPKWQALFDRLPTSYDRTSLSRFMRYCSAAGIGPEDVTDEVSTDFRDALVKESLTERPLTAHQSACRIWSRMCGAVDGWPETTLAVPRYRQTFTLPWDTFPESFRHDVEAFSAALRSDDLFAENAPVRPLREGSIKTRVNQIRFFSSALIHAGHDPSAITSLAYLVDRANFEAGLRHLLDRNGGKTSKSISDLAWCLRTVAVHHAGVTGDDLERIKTLTRRLQPPSRGLTEKNRGRLRQFDDPENLRRLLLLPATLFAQAQKVDVPRRREALLVQHALAIELLTVAPMRIDNLACLHMENHLSWSRSNWGGVVHITIPEGMVKNDQDLEFELPEETASLLRLYISDYRDLLFEQPGPWLFPSRDPSRPKRSDTLSRQISARIWDKTGIKFNPHLFRHLAASLILKRHPDGYGTASRVLGHRNANTVYKSYSGLEAKAAHRMYVEEIIGRRCSPREEDR